MFVSLIGLAELDVPNYMILFLLYAPNDLVFVLEPARHPRWAPFLSYTN